MEFLVARGDSGRVSAACFEQALAVGTTWPPTGQNSALVRRSSS